MDTRVIARLSIVTQGFSLAILFDFLKMMQNALKGLLSSRAGMILIAILNCFVKKLNNLDVFYILLK